MRLRAGLVACSLLLSAFVLRPEAFDARLPLGAVEAQPLAGQATRVADALAYEHAREVYRRILAETSAP